MKMQSLEQWQQQQREALTRHGLPTRKHEHWRYLDLTALNALSFNHATPSDSNVVLAQPLDQAVQLVFVNGYFRSDLSSAMTVPGLRWSSVRQSPAALTLLARQHTHSPYSHLNAALLTDGVHLSIADDVTVAPMIHLLFVTDNQSTPTMQHPRHVVTLGRQAKATIVEQYHSVEKGAYFTNGVLHLDLAAGAQLTHCKLQAESLAAYHISETIAECHQHSHLQLAQFSRGGKLSRDGVSVHLREAGASCQLIGLAEIANQQTNDMHSVIHHHASHTVSEQYVKGLYHDSACGVFNGKIQVDQHANQVVAHQTNKNLLLSAAARVNTKPELEIYAEDVRCSHGATVGQLDESALFYLRSRGLSLPKARELLTEAFADEIILKLERADLIEYVKRWRQ